jgi:retron-type reverse transcriptase
VSIVEDLKKAKSLDDLAAILGYKSSGLSYILYKSNSTTVYAEFKIPKRNGGVRIVKAPEAKLKLLQRRLANVLYIYLEEIEDKKKPFKTVSHGFAKGKSIITNATVHKRSRYVLNLDLEDFFPTINFGRVRGLFIKDKRFEFHPSVATCIAQIACHDNTLPQGSPCSPIISNIVGRLLDVRLVRLAKIHKCTYSRYADDITFSTNQKEFPVDLAYPDPSGLGEWLLAQALTNEINGTGFAINAKKTRMQVRGSRQLATGLLVNEKVNVRPEYYRTVRSMCSSLFQTGSYYRMMPAALLGKPAADPDIKVEHKDFGVIEGMLGHIYHVRNTVDRRESAEKKKFPTTTRKLYHRLLFFKNFVTLDMPLIVTEGKTDPAYLKAAVERLPKFHPRLGILDKGKLKTAIRFMNFSSAVHDVLQLGRGVEDLKFFILRYKDIIESYKYRPLMHPVIVLIDNDEGTKEIFGVMRQITSHNDISTVKSEPFYRISSNLYVVKTPETGKNKGMTCIEDLFDPMLFKTVLNGKVFDPDKKHNEKGKYGKHVFVEKVIRPNKAVIDFSKFDPLLSRIVAVLDDYAVKPHKWP